MAAHDLTCCMHSWSRGVGGWGNYRRMDSVEWGRVGRVEVVLVRIGPLLKPILYYGPDPLSKSIFVSRTPCQNQYKLDFSDEKQ